MNYKLIRSVLRFLGMLLVVGTAVALAYPTDTKPAASAAKLKKPATTTTNRMQKRLPAAKPAGGEQLEYAKPTGTGGVKVNSTLTQKAAGGAGNNKNIQDGGNAKVTHNTVNKAGWDVKAAGDKSLEVGQATGTRPSVTGGAGGAGNNKNTNGGGNAKVNQNTVNKAGYQLGGSHGDDTPTGNSSATGGAGSGRAKSTAPAKTTSSIKQ